jgi:hypothetical protein
VTPPHFSIATVTKVATIPANRAESKTDCPRIKSRPDFHLDVYVKDIYSNGLLDGGCCRQPIL